MCQICCTRLFFASVSSSSIVWKSPSDTSMSSRVLYPICRKYVFNLSDLPVCFGQCWFNKYASSFCLLEETLGDLRPVRINSKTSWTSSPSQPTCRESSPDGLGNMISNSNRNVHTRCGIHDVQHLQSCLHTKRFLECDLPEIHIHGHNVIESLCMIHRHFSF